MIDINNMSEGFQRSWVLINPLKIDDIINPSDNVIRLSLEINPHYFYNYDLLSYDLKKYVIGRSPSIVRKFKNLEDSLKEYALSLDHQVMEYL